MRGFPRINLKKHVLMALFLCSTILSVRALDIESGKVYRVVNAGTPAQSMAVNTSGKNAVTLATDATNDKQQWLITANADNTGYYFRNVATGGYLASSKATSAIWTLSNVVTPVDDNMLMTIADAGDGKVTIKAGSQTGTYPYAHKDASNNVVCWSATANSPNSYWTIVPVVFSDDELQSVIDRIDGLGKELGSVAEYQKHLDALFEDKACTKLKQGVLLEGNADFDALSPKLQEMVAKVSTGIWDETNRKAEVQDWDSDHAYKYRVQLYEPYSEGSAAAALAGIQAYTNMNNPTGILADRDDFLYIMVDDEVPEGATLYIGGVPDTNMYNTPTAGIELKRGLNIIACNDNNSHFFIYYTVNTVQRSGSKYVPTAYKVTDYSPIKIHIEGGRLNGFFNYIGDDLYEADGRKDFEYTVTRATHPMYDFVGKYVILHLHLEDTPSQEGGELQKCVKSALLTNPTGGADHTTDVVAIMKSWDNMCLAERVLMGIQSDDEIKLEYNKGYYESIVGDGHTVTDGINVYNTDPGFHYSDYLNNRMMGISQQGTLFMNATAWRTAYNVSTIDAILTMFPSGNVWGPAHEYGHMNQAPMNMAGTTEVSNNIFSNVAMYYAGTFTSRCEFLSAQQKNFQEGKTYLEAGTWGTTRMFWQLWCYYHATGHNKKFYPRLYQLLRQYPLVKTTVANGNHNERYDMLQFAKMCCIAAEEDLTNFFTGWGFFQPLENFTIDDYSVYNAYLTEEDIKAVKNEIKAFGFPKNDVILLIDDRPGNDRTSYPGFPKEQGGSLGGLKDFQADNGAAPSGSYRFNVDLTSVSVSTDGEKGVGYLIYDEEENLLGFYNTDEFDVMPEVAAKLMDGTATVKAMGESGDSVEVVNPLLDGSVQEKRDLLAELIGRCNTLLEDIDETGDKVGFLKPESCGKLQELTTEAQGLIDGNSEDGEKLSELLLSLTDEYNYLSTADEARIPIEEGAAYRITNRNYTSKALTTYFVNDSFVGVSAPVTSAPDPALQLWTFEPQEEDNVYAIRNLYTGEYINILPNYKGSTLVPLGEQPAKYTVSRIVGASGVHYFAPDGRTASSLYLNAGMNIYHNANTQTATQWYITRVVPESSMKLRKELEAMIDKASELLESVGETIIGTPEKMTITADCLHANSVQSGAPSAYKNWNTILDNNLNTYFASNRSNVMSEDGLEHYIRISAPTGETFENFDLSYSTWDGESMYARIRSFRIDASIDGTRWAPVYVSSTAPNTGVSATNHTGLVSLPEGVNHIRFMALRTDGLNNTSLQYSFVVSELSVANTHEVEYVPSTNHLAVEPADMEAADKAVKAAKFALNTQGVTDDELNTHLTNLTSAYNNLYEISKGVETAVGEIGEETQEPDVYYDMNGIPSPTHEHGVFIHRKGKKTEKVIIP